MDGLFSRIFVLRTMFLRRIFRRKPRRVAPEVVGEYSDSAERTLTVTTSSLPTIQTDSDRQSPEPDSLSGILRHSLKLSSASTDLTHQLERTFPSDYSEEMITSTAAPLADSVEADQDEPGPEGEVIDGWKGKESESLDTTEGTADDVLAELMASFEEGVRRNESNVRLRKAEEYSNLFYREELATNDRADQQDWLTKRDVEEPDEAMVPTTRVSWATIDLVEGKSSRPGRKIRRSPSPPPLPPPPPPPPPPKEKKEEEEEEEEEEAMVSTFCCGCLRIRRKSRQ